MYKYFKRIFDIIVSLLLIVLLSPILIMLVVVLFIVNKGKPFFLQSRPGAKETIFKVIKFKTMNDKKDKDGNLFPSHLRVTKFGRFLRITSLDELPQLINMIKGDISLVGPRPLRIEYLPLYNEEQKRRHDVKPGITGWAQINGRNAISWEDKFKLDVWYVDNLSFILDIKILFKTFVKVIKRSDINRSDQIIIEPFKGAKLNG